VFIITKDDLVYIFERNLRSTAIIAFSPDNSYIESRIIEQLSHINIVDFCRGDSHSIARTFDGYIYCSNNSNQLGDGKEIDLNIYGPELNQFFSDFEIIEICCGYDHSLALTLEGEVFE